MVNPVTGQQSMPKLDSPLVDDTKALQRPWYQFLIYLWTLLGSGTASPELTVNVAQSTTPGQLDVFNSSGARIGSIALGP